MQFAKCCVLAAVMAVSLPACNQKQQKQEAYDHWNAARASAQGNLASEQYRHGNLAEARRSVDDAIKMQPKNTVYRLLSARIYIEANTLEAAQMDLEEVRKLDPKNAEADYLSGVVYQRWQKPNVALDYYTRAAEKAPAELSYITARAETMVQLGKVGDAIALLESKLTYFEHSGVLRDLLGVLYAQAGRQKEAVDALKQAVILSPDQHEFREHLARVLFRTQQYREAITELTALLKVPAYSRRADTHLLLGECYLLTDRARDARAEFETAANLSPNLTAAWLGVAKASMAINDRDRSEIALQKAIALEPDDPQAHLALGHLRLQQQRYAEAKTSLNKAASLDPADPTPLCLLGMISEKEGKKDEAMGYYGKALQVKPDDELAKSLMSKLK